MSQKYITTKRTGYTTKIRTSNKKYLDVKKNLDIKQKIWISNKKNSDVKKLGIKQKKSGSSQQDPDV